MPRFFFDVQDGNRNSRDQHGIDLPDVSYVWKVAAPMVDEISKARAYMHPPHSIYVVVRNASDVVVYESRYLVRKTIEDASDRPPVELPPAIAPGLPPS